MIIEYRNFHMKKYEGQIIMQATKVSSAKKVSQTFTCLQGCRRDVCKTYFSFSPPGDEGGAVGSPTLLS